MLQTPSILRAPRAVLLPLLITTALGVSWLFAPEGRTQVPAAASTSNAALNALLAKLKTQQDQLAANQTKIEAQTAQLKEEIRQAKLYSARARGAR